MPFSNELKSFYGDRKKNFESQCKVIDSRIRVVSWIRVSLAIGLIVLVYLSFKVMWLWILAAATAIAFSWFVYQHGRLNHRRKLLQNLSIVNEQELKALDGDHSAFQNGEEFVDGHHPYTLDLDIFGNGSLFQRFNRTCTDQGKERLARILSSPLPTAAEIAERQQAVAELKSLVDYRQEFQAIGMIAPERKSDQQEILDWLKLPTFVLGRSSKTWMLIALPALSFGALIYWIVTANVGPFILVALAQWAVVGVHAKRTLMLQDYIGNKRYLFEKFAEHFELLGKQKFEGTLTRRLNDHSHEATNEIRRLVARARALDLRLNPIANLILNSVVLYDLQCVHRLEKWRDQNRDRMDDWFTTIAEADALNSLAAFGFNNPDFVLPEVTTDRVLYAEQLGHPLLDARERVCNDVAMDNESSLWIITGANMAGKSTFLRSVGVNVVLALTGSVVCAKRLVCPLVEIHSGMRNTDSIADHQSYFYAELFRLQGIVKRLAENRQLLILLDEILKGTNSTDKLAGSEQLVSQLVNYPCFTMVATHDVALGEMEKKHPAIRNYHFESRIENDELKFDYILRPGVSTSKNATFLMRKMGIIGD